MGDLFEAKERVTRLLKDYPGIHGIGITWDDQGHPCVRVNVSFQVEESVRQKIPASVEGVPIVIAEVGEIELE